MHMRADRLEEFKNLTWDGELLKLNSTRVLDPMPGLSGMATAGLSTIFTDIPSKFPMADLTTFLQKQADTTLWEVELRLEIMGHRFSGLDCQGNEL